MVHYFHTEQKHEKNGHDAQNQGPDDKLGFDARAFPIALTLNKELHEGPDQHEAERDHEHEY
jgi:hypothetical protein